MPVKARKFSGRANISASESKPIRLRKKNEHFSYEAEHEPIDDK